MDYTKPRKDLIFLVNPLLFILGFILFFFCDNYFYFLHYLFWIITVCAIALVITPLGNRRLGDAETTTRVRWQTWLSSIILIEAAMLGVYFGIAYLCGTIFPINSEVNPSLFSASLNFFLKNCGLFPWTLYAVIAVSMGITAYREKKDAYFSALLNPILKMKEQNTLGLIANVGARRSTTMALSITLLFFALLLVSLVLSPHIHLITGFTYPALLTTLFFLSTLYMQHTKKIIYRLFAKQIPSFVAIPAFSLLFAALLLLVNLLLQHDNQMQPTAPNIIQQWIHYPQDKAWFIFSIMWWVCFTPLLSIFFIKLSRGYRVRDVILGVCALPILLMLFFYMQTSLQLSAITPTALLDKLIPLISFIIFLPAVMNHARASEIVLSYFPKDGVTKHRDYLPFFFRIIQLMLMAFFIYFVVGINALSFLLFSCNFLIIPGLILIAVAALIKCLRS